MRTAAARLLRVCKMEERARRHHAGDARAGPREGEVIATVGFHVLDFEFVIPWSEGQRSGIPALFREILLDGELPIHPQFGMVIGADGELIVAGGVDLEIAGVARAEMVLVVRGEPRLGNLQLASIRVVSGLRPAMSGHGSGLDRPGH